MTTHISKVIFALILTISSFVLVKVTATTYAGDTKDNSIANISDELSSKLVYHSSGHYLVVNAIRKTATGTGYEADVVDP